MREIKLLDCTLRDGGYLNDWNFGHANLISTFERLVNAGVDIIELGFLDERREFDINRSIMPSTECMNKTYGTVDKKSSMVVGMIDYGTCSINQLEPCDRSYLDGIRVIFKKHLMHEAMEFCRQVKELGYNVFSQMVSITSYTDEELKEFIALANAVKPYAVSMVDTYGLLYKDNFLHYFEALNEGLNEEISLGYHSHNNFQLAYSNCMEMLRKQTKRSMLVDATLYGMGKSAGNAPIELLAMHMNEHYGKNYDISQLLEAIDGNIMKFYKETPWGYNLFFYLAAANGCHPNYVQYLLNKHSLSIKSVNCILEQIESDKKLMYSEEYIDSLYYQYQKKECNDDIDRIELKNRFENKHILILGPGKSIISQKNKICDFIEAERPIVISINYIPKGYNVDYVFLSNPRRYIHLINQIKVNKYENIQIIATSNVTETNEKFNFILNNEALLDEKAEIMDNSFVMLLKVLVDKKVAKISCAGLDGYSENEQNYADPDMEYWFTKRKANDLNYYVRKFLEDTNLDNSVHFITPSYYQCEEKNEKI